MEQVKKQKPTPPPPTPVKPKPQPQLIYDSEHPNLILENIPPPSFPMSCGHGKIVYNKANDKYSCYCRAPLYFNGPHCDIPQEKLVKHNKCLVVGHVKDLNNTDISTFDPVLEGVCVECYKGGEEEEETGKDNKADGGQFKLVPIATAKEPMCRVYNNEKDNNRQTEKTAINHDEDPCRQDALNPMRGSLLNKYIPGYGCSCDYHNGYVEVRIEGKSYKNEPEQPNNYIDNHKTPDISHACIKIGRVKKADSFHRMDAAYYTLLNQQKPIQIHSYTALEPPFRKIFEGARELLVSQPAIDIVHKHDWLNRHIKPSKKQKIRRLNYPKAKWPIVDKNNLVNHYRERDETTPVSAYKMAVGRGFETKHWYETTNKRWLSNAVWGHPIMYTHQALDDYKLWNGKTTLNPVGVKLGEYYGFTLFTKEGEGEGGGGGGGEDNVPLLDTRGYKQELIADRDYSVTTIPPDYQQELMDPKRIIYVAILFNSYSFP